MVFFFVDRAQILPRSGGEEQESRNHQGCVCQNVRFFTMGTCFLEAAIWKE